MPAISKIRFTNIVYENGDKRYNDDIFQFDGHNAAILLENGGGKTVFVQTVIQAVLPHAEVADRKIRNTLMLENDVAHVAVEWILNDRPRRYGLTAVTLFINRGSVDSLKYVYEYEENDDNSIEKLPFVLEGLYGNRRPATKEEIGEYYSEMSKNRMNAHSFSTAKEYHAYIEDNFLIFPSEWRNIALINGAEGGVEAFFDHCKTTGQLVDSLLIPVIEEALAGNGTKDFVETFEKQREHFKRHKHLRERIEESKAVEAQINSYVKVFKNYDEVNSKYISAKENAKAIFRFIEQEGRSNEEKLIEVKDNMKKLSEEIEIFGQKKASYQLACLKENVTREEKAFQEVSHKYNELLDSYNTKKKRSEELQVAKFSKSIKEEQESIVLLEEQISKLEEDEDITDIQEKLMQNSEELRGYYLEEEQKLEKEKTIVEGQIETNKKEIKTCESESSKAKDIVDTHKIKIAELDNSIQYLAEEMKKIEREILDNFDQEKVDEQYVKWQDRVVEIEKSIFNFAQEMKKIEEEKYNLNEELSGLRVKLKEATKEETEIGAFLINIEDEHQRLLNDIKSLRVSWSNIDSLYLRKESILNGLIDKLDRLRDEKERLLLKERLAHRFSDDYKENEFYTADPALEGWIRSWRNSFNYIEGGTQFVQRIYESTGKAINEIYEAYPYWAIAVIVSDAEIDKFYSRICKQVETLSHPVIIITEQEARSRIAGEFTLQERSVFPSSWEKNLSQKLFENWKSEFEVKALEATENRIRKEEEFNLWSETLKSIQLFYNKYSHDTYLELQKEHKTLLAKINTLEKDVTAKEERIKQIDEAMKKGHETASHLQDERTVIEHRIIKAQEYKTKRNSKQKNEADKENKEKELKSALEQCTTWERRRKYALDLVEEIQSSLNEINYNLRRLQGEELYEEVRNATAKYSSMSKKALVIQRKDLKDALEKKQKGRELLEVKLENAKGKEEELKESLKRLRKTSEFTLGEDVEFPLYGDEEIDRLLDLLESIKKPLKKLKSELEAAKDAYQKEQNTYDLREKDFYKKYDNIVFFAEALEQVKKELKEEKQELDKREEYNLKRIEQLEKDKKEIEKAINELNIKNGKFAFLAENINEIQLSNEVIQEIPYEPLRIVNNIGDELEELSKIVAEKNLYVDKQKRYFIDFCNSQIIDVRLKDMAISGVEYKKHFKDIIEWQQKMNERIEMIIDIAENDIKEHDKQLQQFINHLHSYLMTMSQELKLIPKKTRIKIEEDWKEIFTFNVPEWDEKEGKEELSKHIDWMLKQLESDQFKDDEGEEFGDKVSKAIEKWLQSKELLRIVMKQNIIKIKCRKVTNDGKVSSMPFSWEQSNAWSGGEKWSKNMTLFLGILNYLAEKRKQIVSNMKRHRTVIVDNPFGKASSDHVLDPVFFIAEQLGFQIIALTAHAEGKFIRTYFPIVYSCRLRDAKNNSTQIMTKEKEVKTAFFKDSDPQTLMRLGQLQQLGMFEY
ncbi:hypothetical protein [Desnuesiella massiliensis]|uniref:hypothetical protein n=1 Tax=Desnuesiella massiliensis TaxID=1650662 RepID=UPI000A59BD46|nr:hypothetical protein [Desnuesiella massiliensis]